MTAFLATPLTSGATTPNQSAFAPGTTTVDLRARVSRANWVDTVNLGAFISNWSSTAANCRYMLSAGTGGTLIAQWYAGAVLQTCTSTVAVGVANGTIKWVRALINPAAGTCDFFTSDDGSTWTNLGAQITGKSTTAVQTPGTAQPMRVGLDASGANGMNQKVYYTQVRVNNVVLLDIDWTTKGASPTGTWAGSTGETWTVVGSAVVNIEDTGNTTIKISGQAAFAYDAGTTTFQITTYGASPPTSSPFSPPDPTQYKDCIDLGEPRATRMLNAMPPYFANDPTIRAYVCACAKELNRIEVEANALRDGAFPDEADLRTLAYYEALFGLTNTALDLTTRRDDVIAHLRKRKVAERYDWQQALQSFIATTGWSYAEAPPYTVNLTTPVDPTGSRTPVIAAYARAITPAHLVLVVNGSYGGFQIGISHIGIDPL